MPAWSRTPAATSSARPHTAARRTTARCSRWQRAPTPLPPWLPLPARTAPPLCRPGRGRQRQPLRHDRMAARRATARCSRWRRVPTPLPPWLLLPDERCQPLCRPGRGLQRQPLRHDLQWRRVERRHGVRGGGGHPYPYHTGYLYRDERREPLCRPGRGLQRQPLRHDRQGRRVERRHGVRGRSGHPHPYHPGYLYRHANGANPYARPGRGHQRQPLRHDRSMAARRTTAPCSRSQRAPTPLPPWLPLPGLMAANPVPA